MDAAWASILGAVAGGRAPLLSLKQETLTEFLRRLFDTGDFPARWHCGRWSELNGWLHILSDSLIALAYWALPLMLWFFVTRRRDAPFLRIFWLFGAFITLCGMSHAIDALIFWEPIYRAQGVVKLATALVSWATVAAMYRVLPQALSLRTSADLKAEVERQTRANRAQIEQIRELEQRFRFTFESAAVGIAHVATDGTWLRVNSWLCDILGYTEEELQQRTFQDLTHPADLERDLQLVEAVLDGTLDHYQMEKRYYRKDGSVLWANLRVSLVRDEAGNPSYFIAVISDINERKQLERRLRLQTRELKEANASLESFAYSVSHDLRAPLRAIQGFSDVLVEDHSDSLDDEARRILGIVRKNGQRMGELIDALLAFSRLGRRALEIQPNDTTTMVHEAFDIAQAAEDPDGTRHIELEIHPLPEAHCDRTLLGQVWLNLATNALKYTREKEVAHIEVGAEEKEHEFHFYVRDNGSGFDPAYRNKLFKVFSRLHAASQFEGTGVGLATVQSIIHRHGGRVWAEGEVDRGAVFWFSLPKHRGDSE